jgi:two-component system LytT family sensor kinase
MSAIKKKDWIEILLHIAFWSGVFYTLLSLTVPHIKMRLDHNGTIVEKDISHTLSAPVFLTFGLLIVLFYGNALWLLKRALYYKNILIRVMLPLVWLSTIFVAKNYLDTLLPSQIMRDDPVVNIVQQLPNRGQVTIHAFAPYPVRRLPDRLAHMQKDRFIGEDNDFAFAEDGFSNTVFLIFVIVFGLSIAWFFLKEWARTEKFRSQLEAVQLDTEVKFLKSQINPHFLFNTLNNLFSMAQGKGNDELADGISKLSGMMRYMIYESNEDFVPLKKEVEYLQNCIVLNELRYADDEVKVVFDYPDKTEGIFIAPMLFIPFVENAFKHGVSIGASSQIDISILLSGKQLHFSCENTNYSFVKKMEGDKSGIGLENIKRRLDLVYPGKHRLMIDDKDGKFNVKLEIEL